MIIIHEYHMMTDDDNINNNKSPKDEWLVSASEREISFVLWVVGIAGSWRFRRTRTESEVEFVLPVWLGRITSP